MKRLVKKILADSLVRQSGWLFASSILTNVFNLFFWLCMVRMLDPQDYGSLNSLISVLVFFLIPVGVWQMVLTRYVSKFMAHDRRQEVASLLFYFIRGITVFLGIAAAAIFFCAPYLSGFLRMQDRGLIYLIGAGIALSSLSSIFLGALSGLQKFGLLAINGVATGAARLLFGFLLVAVGFGVMGGLLGFVLAFSVTLVLSFFHLPSWLKNFASVRQTKKIELKEIAGYFLPVSLGSLCFCALTNMDVILVKHFFTPLEAGFYSVAQLTGKIVLFVPGAVGVVMFPKIVDTHAKNIDPRSILKKGLLITAFLCGAAALVSCLFPAFILKCFTGHNQPAAVSLVCLFTLSMGFFALVNILMLYHLSLHRMRYIYILLAATGLQFLSIWIFHGALQNVIGILLVFSVVLCYIGLRLSQNHKCPS